MLQRKAAIPHDSKGTVQPRESGRLRYQQGCQRLVWFAKHERNST